MCERHIGLRRLPQCLFRLIQFFLKNAVQAKGMYLEEMRFLACRILVNAALEHLRCRE